MNRPELLAPAGSFEGVRAAVQSGADAVYLGFGTFNARRGAKNFTREEMAEAIRYCRARGVKTNVTFNILALDRELEAAMEDVRFLNEAGADALIVQDLGVARLIREHAPDLPLHASTQMTIHNLDGALAAKKLGFSRVVLSRECTLEQIREITARAGVETEVFVHGALCMCYSGQCYLSSVIGRRSGNRGLCAQPCRLPYGYDGGRKGYPLSLKDLSAADLVAELTRAGVASLKIEGRMKRPEYAAAVTAVYAKLLREQRAANAEEHALLRRVFSRDGFTDGYLTGKIGAQMFGVKTEVPLQEVKADYDEAARRFAEGKEAPLVPVDLHFSAAESGLKLTVSDGETAALTVTDPAPVERAQNRPATRETVEKNLSKTGGTPFFVRDMEIKLADGLMLPASRLNALRREALDRLLAQRGEPPCRRWIPFQNSEIRHTNDRFIGYTVEVRSLAQIAPALCENPPATIYCDLRALTDDPDAVRPLVARGLPLAAQLPRIWHDRERDDLTRRLDLLKKLGIETVCAQNLGQLELLRGRGFTVHGGFGLNAANSRTLDTLAELGVSRQTLSFELRLPQMRDLDKPVETELIVYGHLPLMIFENCAIRRKTGKCNCKNGLTCLTDRTGQAFPLLPAYGCRNELFNSQPVWLADRPGDYERLGVQYGRVMFTTEPPARCAEVWLAHLRGTGLDFEKGFTRGLYNRGVE